MASGGSRLRALTRAPRVLWRDLDPMAAEPFRRWDGARPAWAGWAPHAVVVTGAVVLGVLTWHTVAHVEPAATAIPLGVLQGVPPVLCLVRPMAGWWTSVIAAMLVSEVARAGAAAPVWAAPALVAHLGVLAMLALKARPRVLAETWVLTLLAGAILVQRMPAGYDASGLLEMSALSAVVLLAAGGWRSRGEARRLLAEQERISATERERRAMLEERGRIARELHDVLAHHMSVIAIQAEAAPHRVANPPAELRRSFATIHRHAGVALGELRRVLGVLRASGPAEPTAPQPTLRDLGELIDGARAAGLTVTATTTGAARPLPPGLELSAYRIVQEALNNVMRHAPGAHVDVELAHLTGSLRLTVRNGPPATGTADGKRGGHGVLGMRERAAMLGGELTANPVPGGGYLVTAVLPLPSSRAGDEDT